MPKYGPNSPADEWLYQNRDKFEREKEYKFQYAYYEGCEPANLTEGRASTWRGKHIKNDWPFLFHNSGRRWYLTWVEGMPPLIPEDM